MAFPPQFLDELRARLPVSEVVGRKVRLVRKGREFSGLCPFHNEKTPSFTVNDEKAFYHCFGCGAHGDVISFAIETEGLSFPEAVEKLAGQAGLQVPQSTPEEKARAKVRATLYDVVEAVCAWYEENLRSSEGRAAYDYLRGRGFSDETIRQFRLGYAPDGRGRLLQAMESRGIRRDQLVEAGLIKLPEGGGDPRDYFFDRVMFPIADGRGRPIAFGGRIMGDGQPKYLNSPETPLFHKGRNLYNYAMAREASRAAGTVIVAEGYTDVIALAQAGLPNAVAPLGTAVTEEQIGLLWRIVDEPVLCFDGDNAGARAALRAAERAMPILKPGKTLRFMGLPAGEDPDSLVAGRGADGFRTLLAGARQLVDVIWQAEVTAARHDTPERRADLERRINARLAAIADDGVKYHYQQVMRERLRDLFFANRRNKYGAKRVDKFQSGTNRGSGPGAPLPGLRARGDIGAVKAMQERTLLATLVNHPDLIQDSSEALSEISLQSKELDTLLREILNLAFSAPVLDSRDLQRHLIEGGFERLLGVVLDPQVYRQASFAAPDATLLDARAALDEMLAGYARMRLKTIDRADAAKDARDDMNEKNSNRLVSIVRESSNAGGV
ncbi:MAG: DNA primase [Alphaproteobacteria bacterium]|nr:DNA primase [Alphaproteobacteria bacterium]